jgi:hypothetical protein
MLLDIGADFFCGVLYRFVEALQNRSDFCGRGPVRASPKFPQVFCAVCPSTVFCAPGFLFRKMAPLYSLVGLAMVLLTLFMIYKALRYQRFSLPRAVGRRISGGRSTPIWARRKRGPESVLYRALAIARVMVGPEKMWRDVQRITNHPTVVTGRSRWNVEEHAGTELVDFAVLHHGSCTTGEHQLNMLDAAAPCAHAGSYVNGPLPSGLVCGGADGRASDANDFEFSFFERSYLVWLFKAFQNCLKHRRNFPCGHDLPQIW